MSNWERLRGDLSVIANSKVSDAAKRTPPTASGRVQPLRSLSLRGQRGNHTIYFCELLRATVRVNLGATRGYVRPRGRLPSASIPKTFPSDQCLDPNLVALRGLALPESGAGDGSRTHENNLKRLSKKPMVVNMTACPARVTGV